MKPETKSIIFVGGIKTASGTQHPGGQMTASRSLLASDFVKRFRLFLIDTAGVDFPPETMLFRIAKGLKRTARFLGLCILRRPAAALIFSCYGLSLVEKVLFCAIGRIFGVKSVLSLRSGHFMDQVRSSRFRGWYHFLLRVPHLLLCQSRTWADFYEGMGVPAGKCVVVHNWIDPSPYISCRTLQPAGTDVTFLYVGTLSRAKGIFDLIHSISIVRHALPGARWVIVGGGETKALRAAVDRLQLNGCTTITGWQTGRQLLHYYRVADIFVLPTYAEGFPNVLLEAMSAGLPVITTPVGGIPGVLHDHVNGLLVPPGDTMALAEAMVRLARDELFRQRLSDAAIRHVHEHHDIGTLSNVLSRVIDGLISGNALQAGPGKARPDAPADCGPHLPQ